MLRKVLACSAALLLVLPGASAQRARAATDERETAEAALVRGLELYRSGEMRTGLETIRAAASRLRELPAASSLYAVVALRSGNFREAERLFTGILGGSTAAGLASGETTARTLGRAVDREALLGLAVCRGELGALREADRLFRAFIDLSGPTSRDAARAYSLMAGLYETAGISWGDPDAARASSSAIAPDLAPREVLPPFPDPANDESLEPYTRAIEPAAGQTVRVDSLSSLPRLIRWSRPAPIQGSPLLPPNVVVRVELLVTEDGLVDSMRPAWEADPGDEASESAESAAASYLFEPALDLSGSPVSLWILRDIAVPRESRTDR